MKTILLLGCFVFSGLGFAQTKKIDSLKKELIKPHPDTTRFRILVKLIQKVQKINLNEASEYSENLMKTATKIGGLYYADACYYTGQLLSYQGKSDSAIM